MNTLRIIACVWCLLATSPAQWHDTLNVQFDILYQEYNEFYNVIKIKLPSHLSTAEVMAQIRLLLFFPGCPPPSKETRVYVFRELDTIGAVSKTGCIYRPGKGFLWDLRDWHPDSSLLTPPTEWEKQVYNEYLDSLFAGGMHLNEYKDRAREVVARRHGLTPRQLDTLYYRVKYWWERNKHHPASQKF